MDKKAPLLESERLLLEPLSLSHLSQEYLNWLNDPEVINYIELEKGYTAEQLEKYIHEVEKKNILFWAIIVKQSSKHIGNIKIDPVNVKDGLCEYGILLGDKGEWGKGLAKEASLKVIDYCFNILHLRKMTLGVVEKNINAVELYKKIGFIIEGVYKDHIFRNDQYMNTLRMALFNKNYLLQK
jgi:ribosomal-protein-alanine N-acetyltransferase